MATTIKDGTPPTALPSTMKAWTVVSRSGNPSTALKLETAHPTPPAPPAGNDVTVRVSYAALNPVDMVLMSRIPTFLPFRRRPTPGFDFCGTVVATGPSVVSKDDKDGNDPAATGAAAAVKVGAIVCGFVPAARFALGTGSLAEYVAVPVECVVVKPEGMEERQAAGLGIAGQTAVLILSESDVKKGERVLINGISGGVGTIVCQVLNAMGAVVFGICSGRNEEMVKRLGATEVIDYTKYDPLHEYLAKTYADKPFDKIIDCNGSQALYDKCEPYLNKSGMFVSIAGGASQGVFPWIKGNLVPSVLGGTPRKFKILPLSPSGKSQRKVVEWVNSGLLKEVQIDSEHPMDDLIQALEKVESKRARGKVVVRIPE